MKQRLHPDDTWTAPYGWKEVDTTQHRQVGGFKELTKGSHAAEWVLEYEHQTVVCTMLGSNMVRLRVLKSNLDETVAGAWESGGVIHRRFEDVHIETEDQGETFCMRTADLELRITKEPFSFALRDCHGTELMRSGNPRLADAPKGFSACFPFVLTERDRFFGFGGRTVPPEHRETTKDLFAIKVAHERGDYGGFPMPFFMNPRGYGMLLDHPWPHVYYDLGYTQKNSWCFYTPDGPVDMYLIAGDSFSRILQGYYALTGKPALPPKSYFGLWYSQARYASAGQWEEWAERLRREGWPADAIVLDLYWRGGGLALHDEAGDGCNLEWDKTRFGNGVELVQKLHAMNYQVGLHINTRMYTEPLLSEGLKRQALRRAPEQQVVPVFDQGAGEEWNWSFFAPRVLEGADFWWTDNGERVDGELANGLPSRNLFGQQWNEFLFKHMTAMGKGGRLVLARGGWIGAHRSTLPWPGDTTAGVDRIREDLWFTMNLAMSGVLFSSVDLGGFRVMDHVSSDVMGRDENIIRRVIHGFFLSSTLRIHAGGREEYGKFPWLFGEEVRRLFRFYLELRYRMLPYIYSAAVEGVQQAIPLLRPLAFDYPADEAALAVNDQLMLGPSLLVAPVTEEGRNDRKVYLPEGQWFDYWTDEALQGGRAVVAEAPLYGENGLPLFVAAGSVIPYRPLAQYNAEADEPVILLDLYIGDSMVYRLWEEAGRASTLRLDIRGDTAVLQVENNTTQNREYRVKCRGDRRLGDTSLNGISLDAAPDGRLPIVVPPYGSAVLTGRLRIKGCK
ncbi:MAG: family 31 glycosyl hydrolase, alpha-glucosidase [Paenibacillaceae bacterium]|jgi:alpha-D-xyloside xylohydrolase|nr:family 31 glycosyl hydrolase, alpha-glucosidase [Paenibacillaceae bacterium]